MKKLIVWIMTCLLITGCSNNSIKKTHENESKEIPYELISGGETLELENGEKLFSNMVVKSVIARELTDDDNYEFTKKAGEPASNDLVEKNLIVEIAFEEVTLIGESINIGNKFTPQIWNNDKNIFSISEQIKTFKIEPISKDGKNVGEKYSVLSYKYLVPKNILIEGSQFKLMPDIFFDIEGVE